MVKPRLSFAIALAALTVICTSTTVRAAALYGALRANFGDGYVLVDDGTRAQPGVSVMAQPGGSGEIVYDNGCTVPVAVGEVKIVEAAPPCAEAASTGPSVEHVGLKDWAIFTLPTLGAVGGGVGLYYLIHGKGSDDSRPASP